MNLDASHQNICCLWDFLPRARGGRSLWASAQTGMLPHLIARQQQHREWHMKSPPRFTKCWGVSGWINRLMILVTAASRTAKQKLDIWSHSEELGKYIISNCLLKMLRAHDSNAELLDFEEQRSPSQVTFLKLPFWWSDLWKSHGEGISFEHFSGSCTWGEGRGRKANKINPL